jgi:D-xylose transport system substrate-binding protein
LLLVSFCLSGCGKVQETKVVNANQDEEKIQIGMLFDTFVIERWQIDRDIFVSDAKELGAEVDVQNANGDADKQVEQMNYFINQKVDVIVVVPIDGKKLAASIKKAKEAGIKIISYDRLIPDANTDLYISFDNETVGKLMGEAIKSRIGSSDSILMVCGPKSDSNVSMVNQGFQNELSGSRINVRDIFYTLGWKAEYAYDYMETWEDNIGEIKAIMCGNDNVAGEVIQMLSEQRLAGEVCVVGQDADLDACQRIVEGTQYMTVYKPFDQLASKAAQEAVKLAKGEDLEADDTIDDGTYEIPYIKIQPIAVTMVNMNEVIIDSGFHLKEDVYLNRPELMN